MTYLWSEVDPFKNQAVRHRDIGAFVNGFCKKNNWDDANWTQQLTKAVKKGDVERFFYDDQIHSPRPYYRPPNTNYPPLETEDYQKVKHAIMKLLSSGKSLSKTQILEALDFDKKLVKNALSRLTKEEKLNYIPPKEARYSLKV